MKNFKKNGFLSVTLFLVFFIVLVLSFDCRAAAPAGNVDYIAIYKSFFSNLNEKKYTIVWNNTARESKMQIAALIAKETKGKATPEEVFNMLETDQDQVRTMYFDEFLKEVGDLMINILKSGKFTLKSVTPDKAMVNIDYENDPMDFSVVKESGAWKVNFFYDLFNK